MGGDLLVRLDDGYLLNLFVYSGIVGLVKGLIGLGSIG